MGSGPSLSKLLAATCVCGDSHAAGNACGGKPSNAKAAGVLFELVSTTGRHTTGTPLLLDLARADSNSAVKRSASRSKRVWDVSRKVKLTAAVPMAIKAMTTSNSMRVKPKLAPQLFFVRGCTQANTCEE